MLTIRQTIINEYYTCPYKCMKNWGNVGEAGYYEENESVQNKYTATGIALHETMELWGKDKISNSVKTIEEYHEYLDSCIDSNCPDKLFDNEEKEMYRTSLHEQLDWLLENADSNEIIGVEWNFSIAEMFEGVNEPVTGTIDRIDGDIKNHRATLIDYKSGKCFTKKKLKTNVQALFYILAFFKQYGFLPEKFVFYFSKHKRKQIIWVTPEFLQDATAEFLSAYYKMCDGDWTPNNSNKFFCKNFCEHYKECPKFVKKNKWNTEYEVFNPNANL